MLEGGYSIQGGTISALGQSVAAHVRALMRANNEHYFESSNQEDLDKLLMKNMLLDKFRELKRKRVKYNRQVEEEYLKEIEEKIDPDTVGYLQEDEDEESEDNEDDSGTGNNEESPQEESQRQDEDQDEDLGNRTIE